MSLQPTTGSTGLPVVNQALEPEWVRHGSASTQKAYESALSFEETLVEQLSQSLAATSGAGGESSQGGESGTEEGGSSSAPGGPLSSLLPQALTSSVMQAGGLGLAAQMTRELEGVHSAAQTHASGGTAPAASAGTGTTAGTATPSTGEASTGGTGGTGS